MMEWDPGSNGFSSKGGLGGWAVHVRGGFLDQKLLVLKASAAKADGCLSRLWALEEQPGSLTGSQIDSPVAVAAEHHQAGPPAPAAMIVLDDASHGRHARRGFHVFQEKGEGGMGCTRVRARRGEGRGRELWSGSRTRKVHYWQTNARAPHRASKQHPLGRHAYKRQAGTHAESGPSARIAARVASIATPAKHCAWLQTGDDIVCARGRRHVLASNLPGCNNGVCMRVCWRAGVGPPGNKRPSASGTACC